jgi:hypothetical protein
MLLRPTLVIAAIAVLLSACSSSDGSVPEDQVIVPAKAPSGWTTTDLGPAKIAAPSGWTKDETKKLSATISSTTWRSAPVDGASPSGMEVKVITKPQQAAKKAAKSLAVSAMALLKSGSVEPEQITWPEAKDAYYLDYKAKSGPAGKQQEYATRTAVFDLADGTQVQVTALALTGGTEVSAPKRVLESVVLDKTEKKS